MRQTLARSTRLGCWGLGIRSNFWEDSQRRSFGRAQRGVFDVDVVIWMHIERGVNHQLVFCHIAITCRHVDAHLKASGAERCPCWRNASRFGKYRLRLLEPSQPIWLSVMKHDTRTMWIYVTPAPPSPCTSPPPLPVLLIGADGLGCAMSNHRNSFGGEPGSIKRSELPERIR